MRVHYPLNLVPFDKKMQNMNSIQNMVGNHFFTSIMNHDLLDFMKTIGFQNASVLKKGELIFQV